MGCIDYRSEEEVRHALLADPNPSATAEGAAPHENGLHLQRLFFASAASNVMQRVQAGNDDRLRAEGGIVPVNAKASATCPSSRPVGAKMIGWNCLTCQRIVAETAVNCLANRDAKATLIREVLVSPSLLECSG